MLNLPPGGLIHKHKYYTLLATPLLCRQPTEGEAGGGVVCMCRSKPLEKSLIFFFFTCLVFLLLSQINLEDEDWKTIRDGLSCSVTEEGGGWAEWGGGRQTDRQTGGRTWS